jgi:hypothetical protein
VKVDNGDLLADCYNILNRWKNYFSQVVNVQGVSEVRQIGIRKTEPLVRDPCSFEVGITIAKLKSYTYKSPSSEQILAELFQADGHDQWMESIIVPTHKRSDKSDCNNYHGISVLSTSYRILSNTLLSKLSAYIDEIIVNYQCGFRRNRPTTDQIFAFVKYWRKNGSAMRQYIRYS